MMIDEERMNEIQAPVVRPSTGIDLTPNPLGGNSDVTSFFFKCPLW
jgi:hypothetical protein